MVAKEPRKRDYQETKAFREDMDSNNNRTFELGVESAWRILICFVVLFIRRKTIDNQIQDIGLIVTLTDFNAVCKVGSESFLASGNSCDFDRDIYHEAFCGIEGFFISQAIDKNFEAFFDLGRFRTYHKVYLFLLNKWADHKAAQPF